jgi:hypothetical protein
MTSSTSGFDADFALNTMLPLAKAAYDITKLPTGVKLIATLLPDKTGFVGQFGSITIIAFPGTHTRDEWLGDFDGLAVPNKFGAGMVHQGFQDQYIALRQTLMGVLAKNLSSTLWITGHSLGGALATLCASDNAISGYRPLTYTWAGPRVGWHDYANWFSSKSPNLYRIVNEWDIVPRVPPAINGYEHVGTEVLVDGGRPTQGGPTFLHTAHSLELSYEPGVSKLLLKHAA